MNLQPSEAEAGFDIRVPPTADPASLERRIAEEWAPVSRNMTFEVAISFSYFRNQVCRRRILYILPFHWEFFSGIPLFYLLSSVRLRFWCCTEKLY